MYALNVISENLSEFRQAVAQREAFRPLHVKIKLVYHCNLKCEMCNHWREKRPPPLPPERVMEVLEELAQLGCRKVHFSGGEPLLYPKVPELIEHATALGMRVTMTTNGTRVDKSLAKRLIRAGLRGVNISIDSPERKIHDKIRGAPGAWKLACRAIGYFKRYQHKGKLNAIRMNTVVSRSNYHSLDRLADFAAGLGVSALNLIGVDDHCGEHIALRRSHIQYYNAEVAPRLAERALALDLIRDEREIYIFGRDPRSYKYAKRGEYAFGWYDRHPCFAPWTHSLIDFDGRVYVCCMTRERIEPLGDLRHTSFEEIWTSENYRRIREQMFPPALAACRDCDDFLAQNREILYLSEES